MKWKRHISVRYRLMAIFASLLLLFSASNALLAGLIHMDQTAMSAQQEAYRRFDLISDTRAAVTLSRHIGGQIVSSRLTHDNEGLAKAQAAQEQATRDLDAQLLHLDPFDGVNARLIRTALAEAGHYTEVAVTAMLADKPSEVKARMAEMQKRVDLVEATLQTMSRRERASAQLIKVQAQSRALFVSNTALLVALCAVGIGILITFVGGRSIVRPLKITTEAIRRVNHGETHIDLPPVTDDEFGDMAMALRQFRDQAEKLRRIAYQDGLTGLGSRAYLHERLQKLLDERRGSSEISLALICISVDHLRSVNERLGSRSGDRFLCEAVLRIQRFLPHDVMMFRYSGRKFIGLLEGDGECQVNETRLGEIADCVLRGLDEPFAMGNHQLDMSASIGIAILPQDGETVEHLISSVDAAVDVAKRHGGNVSRFASAHHTAQVRGQMSLAGEIKRGLQNGDFTVFYQPIVAVRTRAVIGAEALVRWNHPERGLLLPGAFIETAESSGLISELGNRALALSHQQSATWLANGLDISIAVNLSARQIKTPDFLARLRGIRERLGEGSCKVELELTESALFDSSEETRKVLAELKQMGYKLGLDDFGTGYSSFSYVQNLPIDKVKIDRMFVANLHGSRQARAIVSATLALANALDLSVVAEGVETVEQMLTLNQLGAEIQQGFLYSKALPPAEFERWVANYEQGVSPALPALNAVA